MKRAPRVRCEVAPLAPPDPDVIARSTRLLDPIARHYFRAETRGLGRVPSGPTILVTSHDGGILPLNGLFFGMHWYQHFGASRRLHILTHDKLHELWQPLTRLLAGWGCVRADREYLDAALREGLPVLVFPGAARESFRSFRARRTIDFSGRKGFVVAAIEWGVPITPVASAGAHETVIVLTGGYKLAHTLGVRRLVRSADVLPVLLGLPWGVWINPMFPQLPLPSKIVNEVLEPIDPSRVMGRALSPRDAKDPAVVGRVFDVVLTRMREGMARLYGERRWPVIG